MLIKNAMNCVDKKKTNVASYKAAWWYDEMIDLFQ